MELHGAGHQAVEVHIHDFLKALHLELAAPVNHRALAKHEHVEPVEARIMGFDGGEIGDIHLVIVQAGHVRAVFFFVILRFRARAPDMHLAAACAEGLGHAIADAARAADDQNAFSSKIRVLHLAPLFLVLIMPVSLA